MLGAPPDTLILPNGTVGVRWRRSWRATRASLRIDTRAGCVVVTIPGDVTHRSGLALLKSHANWVADRLAALPAATPIEAGGSIPICDIPHRIRHVPDKRGGAWIEDGELRVTGAPEFLRRRVLDFMAAEARRKLVGLVAGKAAIAGVTPKRVTVKDTKSRWGSCAADKSLSFSWRLVMAPEWVQDYIVAHEVAHIGNMNHGPAFWAQVARLTENTKAAEVWLDRNGARLQRVGS